MGKIRVFIFVLAVLLALMSQFITAYQRDVFNDDAWYYTVPARNLIRDGKITFDGTAITNGFHPLFFIMQVFLVGTVGTDADPLLIYRGINVLIVLSLFIPLCILAYLFQKEESFGPIMAVSVLAALFPKNIHVYYNGMESAITLPILCFFLLCLYRERYFCAGIAGAFLVSARLDTFIFIVIPVTLVYLLYRRKGWLYIIMPPAVFVLIYSGINYVFFGHYMPISGMLRSSFPFINMQVHNLFKNYMPLAAIIMSAGGVIMLLRRKSDNMGVIGIAGGIASLSQIIGIVLFQKWGKPVSIWYLGLLFLCALVCFTAGMYKTMGARLFRYFAVIIICAVFIYNLAFVIRRGAYFERGFDIGYRAEIVEYIGERGGLWAYTDCGAFAFWSGVDFVNLDGLMNGLEYQGYLKRGELGTYLRERGVDYLIAGIWDREQDYRENMYAYRVNYDVFTGDYEYLDYYLYSYRWGVYSEVLKLGKEREIYRSAIKRDGKANAVYIVYDMRDYYE